MLNPDEMARKVAEKHRILIGLDDPVFAFVALNDVCMGEYSQTISQGLRDESERLTVQIQTSMKQQTAYIRQQIQKEFLVANGTIAKTAEQSYEKIFQALSDHIKVISELRDDAQSARKSAWVGVVAAIIVNLIGFAALLVLLRV
ncbi:MAG TPA: hypothetical protein VE954_26195 [Oligoflexus sp.]|uniref:hypothetical protein n=1 Tax=Oligoflexus sp. TaxID=1971216 RepID=UPI002D6A5040|nr:hypothetical protein [Oligoflexus sp.]HYX36616.1 hypothetical protein [Oligoflexus sp.]